MTRDCRPLGTEGSGYLNLTGTHSHFRGVVLPFSSRAGFCDSRFPTAHAREALHFVNGSASSGTSHVSQKTPDHSKSAALLTHAQWAPGCHRSTALDRGTGKERTA
ncbi:unnamed protein product [Staurois parvus]|uniref:Uncharacterized protein n=1 Tax=Staurois parvus TaxID=386267 RepID=A0ABN9BAR2_9NEOB|nr:unnamed protein product [Staurois parvus]